MAYDNSDLLPMFTAIYNRLKDMDNFADKLLTIDTQNDKQDGGLYDAFAAVYSWRNPDAKNEVICTEIALDVIFQLADVLNICDEMETAIFEKGQK